MYFFQLTKNQYSFIYLDSCHWLDILLSTTIILVDRNMTYKFKKKKQIFGTDNVGQTN